MRGVGGFAALNPPYSHVLLPAGGEKVAGPDSGEPDEGVCSHGAGRTIARRFSPFSGPRVTALPNPP